MADVQHKNISDPNLHEPKGVAAASADQVYVSDGAGSGTWTSLSALGFQLAEFACLRLSTDQTTVGISTDYQVIDDSTLSISYDSINKSDNMANSLAGGYVQVPNTGAYQVVASINILGTVASARYYAFTIGVDTGSGFVAQDSYIEVYANPATTTDAISLTLACIPSLGADDKVCLMAKVASGTVSEFEILGANLTINQVA